MNKSLMDILGQRRSVRKFQHKAVSSEHLHILKEAILRAPSSRSLNPWSFVFVRDKELIASLSRAKEHGSSFLKGAPLAVVVCGEPAISDVWVEDCSIASIVIQLAAEELGLGSCWIQIRKRKHAGEESANDYVKATLGLKKDPEVESIIAIGHPDERHAPHAADALDWGKVSDRF